MARQTGSINWAASLDETGPLTSRWEIVAPSISRMLKYGSPSCSPTS